MAEMDPIIPFLGVLPMNSKTKTLQSCYIGIDLAKRFFTIRITNENDEIIDAFDIKPDMNGFDKLLGRIPKNSTPTFGLENTGPLATNCVEYLKDKDQEVILTNSFVVARLRDVFTATIKNDDTDALVIAIGLRMGVLKHSMKSKKYHYLQDALEYREDLVKRKTMVTNQLRDNLVETFPEIEEVFNDITCNASLAILENYPTASDICDTDTETIREIVLKASGRMSKKKMEKLFELSKNSVASMTEDIHRVVIMSQVQELKTQKQLLKQVDKSIDTLSSEFDQELKLLESVPGVGDKTSKRFLAIAGNVERFQRSKDGRGANRLLEFIGFGLREYSSGEKHQIGSISKRGNSKLRGSLYMAAMTAKKVDKDLNLKYESYKARCGSGKKALVAIARTLARRMYGVLKSSRPYDPEIPRSQGAAAG